MIPPPALARQRWAAMTLLTNDGTPDTPVFIATAARSADAMSRRETQVGG